MDKKKAKVFYSLSLDYMQTDYPRELEWVRKLSPDTFHNMRSKRFMEEYVWVVYCSGFKASIIDGCFDGLQKAFKDFDLDSMARMRSTNAVLQVFGNEIKARNVIDGAKSIVAEGFSKFKRRVEDEGVDAFEGLPGIGSITKNHLARNTGLASVPKNDRWLQRLVTLMGCRDLEEYVGFLSEKFKEKPGVVDNVLWRFCADEVWKEYGIESLELFIDVVLEINPSDRT